MRPILVVNPNSNPDVTAGLDAALAGFRLQGGPAIECLTLAEGPFGIESARDEAMVLLPLARLVESRPDAAAFVIACYSDPGVRLCRTLTRAPVLGIQECGVMSALARAERFGVIALSEASIAGHRRALRLTGALDRLAAERPVSLDVAACASASAFPVVLEAGRLLAADGAGAVILGCAGMARHRAALEQALGLPVIDPTQAAVAMALGAVLA